MGVSAYQRYCLNLQGYSHLSDEQKGQIDIAQRFKPAVCVAIIALALITQSLPLALGGVALGFWAALFPYHPVDLIYGALQRSLKVPNLGQDPTPRRFACGMAATLLLLGGLAWAAGAAVVGTIIVAVTAAALLTLVLTDFCVGSFFYWLVVRRQVFRGV